MTARECAKELIKPYVVRGDNIESLAKSYHGSFGGSYDAQIGGYILNNVGKDDQKSYKLSCYQIGVSEVEGVEVMAVFSLKELYYEILDERDNGEQIALDL